MDNVVEFKKDSNNEQLEERMDRLAEEFIHIVYEGCIARYGTEDITNDQFMDLWMEYVNKFSRKLMEFGANAK